MIESAWLNYAVPFKPGMPVNCSRTAEWFSISPAKKKSSDYLGVPKQSLCDCAEMVPFNLTAVENLRL